MEDFTGEQESLIQATSDRISIAVIAHLIGDGGAVAAVAWNHVQQLSKVFDVHVIAQNIVRTESNSIHFWPIKSKSWQQLRRFSHVPREISFQRAARKALLNVCKRVPLAAVWVHSHGTVKLTAYPVSLKSSFRILMTTHGDIFGRPSGTYDFLLTGYYKLVTRAAYSLCDQVHVLSPSMAASARNGGANCSRISIIPNGVSPSEIGLNQIHYRNSDDFIRREGLNILFVGNLLPIKSPMILLKAAHQALDSGRKIFLTLIGEGTEKVALEDYCFKYALTPYVSFEGFIPRSELSSFMNNSDILCVPSLSEALPTVILEAYCSGLPVIGANTGGIPFLVNEKRGFLFPPGDSNALAEKFSELAADKSEFHALSSACSKAACEEYGWEAIGSKLTDMLDKTINK